MPSPTLQDSPRSENALPAQPLPSGGVAIASAETVRHYKYIAIAVWVGLAVALAGGLGVYAIKTSLDRATAIVGGDESGLPVMFPAPTFALTNQDGAPVSSSALEGKPYVAAFIYSTCTTACPMISGRMSTLQNTVTAGGVKLVSFTVDPVRDTPAVLKSYAAKFSADTSRWFFLTGTPADMTGVEKGFFVHVPSLPVKTTVAPGTGPSTGAGPATSAGSAASTGSSTADLDLLHSDRFFLVDAKGQVRGIYDAKDELSMTNLQTDAIKLTAGVK